MIPGKQIGMIIINSDRLINIRIRPNTRDTTSCMPTCINTLMPAKKKKSDLSIVTDRWKNLTNEKTDERRRQVKKPDENRVASNAS